MKSEQDCTFFTLDLCFDYCHYIYNFSKQNYKRAVLEIQKHLVYFKVQSEFVCAVVSLILPRVWETQPTRVSSYL